MSKRHFISNQKHYNQGASRNVEPAKEVINMDEDDIEETAAPNEAEEVVEETVSVVELPVTKTVQPTVVNQPLKEQPKMSKAVSELDAYAEVMFSKKEITPAEGGVMQYKLFSILKGIINLETQEEFNSEFNSVLRYFFENNNKGFNENFIFRFPEQWPGSQAEYTLNRRLIYLIIQTANPINRKYGLRAINMETVCTGLTENQKTKLFSFYGI